MTLRGALVEVHSWIGLTAGLLLAVIGLSGALLAFRAEITEALDPTLFQRPIPVDTPAGAPPRGLDPAALIGRLAGSDPDAAVQSLTLYRDPHHPARVGFAPAPGERRGPRHWVDPWTGAILPEARADPFFETVEALHRWLLLPREEGKPITGSLAILLIVLAISGLYLRWPRRVGDWRGWLRIDLRLRGRALLWNLHAVVGTVALLCYLLSASTGIYWAFDSVRRVVDNAVGERRAVQTAGSRDGRDAPPPIQPDVAAVWQTFQSRWAARWQEVTLRLPAAGGRSIEVNVLPIQADHERARDRLSFDAATGSLLRERAHTGLPTPTRLVNSIYALHLGTYWGLPGRIVMALASLALVGFALTGWLLYLDRRRSRQASRAERQRAEGSLTPTRAGAPDAPRQGGHGWAPASGAGDPTRVLVAYASQTGQAERLAWQTARALRAAGLAPEVHSLARLGPGELAGDSPVLLLASSTGDGEAPDAVRRFARLIERMHTPLAPAPRYGLLALGDRHYPRFCGFGRSLDAQLQRLGARTLFPRIEVDGLDPTALAHWQDQLGVALGRPLDADATADGLRDALTDPWHTVALVGRCRMNPGSPGTPLHRVRLQPPEDTHWLPGALLEIRPPAPAGSTAGGALADTRPRTYSIASLPQDGHVELWVREHHRPDGGRGRVSGWLADALPGQTLDVRLRSNPGFGLIEDDRPCLFIGNGSGYAGLRAHLLERARRHHPRNWLIFGERHATHDDYVRADLAQWQETGMIERLDLAWSRDPEQPRRYVQDALRAQGDTLRRWVAEGAVIYVCGSREGMGSGVTAALETLLDARALEALRDEGRERRDLY